MYFFVPQKKESHPGLEQKDAELIITDTVFNFLLNYPFFTSVFLMPTCYVFETDRIQMLSKWTEIRLSVKVLSRVTGTQSNPNNQYCMCVGL